MKITKILTFIILAVVVAVFPSCANKAETNVENSSTDIVGSYSPVKSNNVYYFSSDGRIYENDSIVSESCYEIQGDKIITYNEGDRENSEMVFDFKLTEDGFMMGQLEYIRIPDLPEQNESEKSNENS